MKTKDFYNKEELQNLKLSGEENCRLSTIDSFDLLKPNRFDLMVKYMYLKFRYESVKSDLAELAYYNHIVIFSEGRFYEPGSKTKNSYKEFVDQFQSIYESIKDKGFDRNISIIPVGEDGVSINGGHRIAASIYLKKDVPIVIIDGRKGPLFNYVYFSKKNMSPTFMDFAALNYMTNTKRNIFIICLWPRATKIGRVKESEFIISKHVDIIYKKSITFNRNGLKTLMTLIYEDQDWIGNINNKYAGVYGKLDECYAESETIFYFVEGSALDEILLLKEEIRDVYGIQKHSVHITDTRDESISIANILLNDNAIDLVNFGDVMRIDFSEINHISDRDNGFILCPAYTLKAYGYKVEESEIQYIDCAELNFDTQYDIRNFFIIKGFKFLSPSKAIELSNPEQAKIFKKIIENTDPQLKKKIFDFIKRIKYLITRELKATLRKLGLYDTVRNLLRK